MKHYIAPLEGITGYIFRNAMNTIFHDGTDAYFAPFIMPHVKRPLNHKEYADVCKENNSEYHLIPQILTNDAEGFISLAGYLHNEFGYDEINLNLGCPSKTVANKGRGSGFLVYPDKLDEFLYSIFENHSYDISVKTRLGMVEPEEFYHILEIYNKYPIKELTIHPRVQKEQYSGLPHTEFFIHACNNSTNKLCYNGNVYSVSDYNSLCETINNASKNNQVKAMMYGRGILRNPALIREITGGKPASNSEIHEFLSILREGYCTVFSGETPVLFKMKEIWSYLQFNYPDQSKICHKMLKSKTIAEYLIYEKQVLG